MRKYAVAVAAVVLMAAFGAAVHAEDTPDATLKVGDKAPDVTLPNPKEGADQPATIKLSDLHGKNVLLAFYPKAFTPGCTKQMCGYRDDFSRFKDANTTVIAISFDQPDASANFKKEYKLPFEVVPDPNGVIIKKFEIPTRKAGDAEYVQRSVVLIDKDGVIRYIDHAYDVDKSQQPLFDAIAKLNAKEEKAEGA